MMLQRRPFAVPRRRQSSVLQASTETPRACSCVECGSGVGGAAGGQHGNRIHREDLARLIVHCLLRDASGHAVPPTLIAADHDTTPTHEIESWLAIQLGSRWRGLRRVSDSRRTVAVRTRYWVRSGFSHLSYLARGLRAALDALGHSKRASGARCYRTSMASTSMSAPFGSAATCTHARW